MKTYPPEAIRNVGLFGHQGTGKTSLAEALEFLSVATTRVGRVEDGNTVCDFEPEEIKKGLSVSLALTPVEWHGHKINLIDVPGYADFIGEAQAALRVVDLAIFVLSAVEGVQVQHQIIWSMAGKLNVPRIVFINKLDRERASFSRTLAELSEKLGSGFAPVDLPIGEEHNFAGVVDVPSRKAYRYDGSGKGVETELSGPLAEEAERLHTQIEESVAESDDALLERYLDGGEITMEQVVHGLAKGLLAGTVTPVLVGSATKLIGIDRLADSIVEEGPSPLARGPAEGVKPGTEETLQRAPSPDAPVSAFVFKTVSDPYVGRISLFRVFSGRLRPDSTVYNATQGTDERVGQIFALRGKAQVPMTEVVAGDIAAVAKLAHTHSYVFALGHVVDDVVGRGVFGVGYRLGAGVVGGIARHADVILVIGEVVIAIDDLHALLTRDGSGQRDGVGHHDGVVDAEEQVLFGEGGGGAQIWPLRLAIERQLELSRMAEVDITRKI